MGKKLRVGIIGTGGIAHVHMKAYQTFDDVEIVGAADIVPGKSKEFLDKYNLTNAKAFDSAAELIKNVEMDAVSVCTYNTTHAENVIMALEAGLHVQCEKPMSFTLQESVDMVKASRKANRILTIGFQPRYDRDRKRVDDIINSGALGKIYYIQSGGGRRRGIPAGTFVDVDKAGFGCLGDIGCYSIDECLHAVKYPKPISVSATSSNYFGTNPKYFDAVVPFKVDDFAVALVRMENDLTFMFRQSWAMHADTLGDTLWLGTEGAIKIKNEFDFANKPSRIMYFTDVNGQNVDSFVLPSYPFNAYDGPEEKDIFRAKIRDFCDAVIQGRPAPIPGEEIIYNQAICDGIYRSSKLNKEVEIIIPSLD